jgi:CheY-like chemotaxis protein
MLDRLSGEAQSNARLATDVPETLRDIKVSTIHHLAETKTGVVDVSQTGNAAQKDWHILVVEDNLVNQRILAQQLRKLGCTVLVANHGQEALDLIEQSKYYRGLQQTGTDLSVVLMDLEMPVMDGLTAVKRIREMEADGELVNHLPVIAVTANARGEQIALAKDSGMVSVSQLFQSYAS